MNLQKVYETEDYGMGYGHKRVGLRVDNQIIWFAYMDSKSHEEHFKRMESLVENIVETCGKGCGYGTTGHQLRQAPSRHQLET